MMTSLRKNVDGDSASIIQKPHITVLTNYHADSTTSKGKSLLKTMFWSFSLDVYEKNL